MVIGKEKENVSELSSSQTNLGDDRKIASDGSILNGDLGINSNNNNNRSSNNMSTELELLRLIQNNRMLIERENSLNISRSGSAPPTVEGAFRALRGIRINNDDSNNKIPFLEKERGNSFRNEPLTEEEIRMHPAYLSYYYSNENSNPRLPPPLMSRENWLAAQRIQGLGSTMGGNWINKDSWSCSSLFSKQQQQQQQQQQQILMQKEPPPAPQKSGMGGRRKSFADIVQEGIGQSSQLSSHKSPSGALDTAAGSGSGSCSGSENKESLKAMHQPPHGSGFSSGLAHSKSFSAAGSSSSAQTKTTSERHQTLRFPPGFPAVQNHVSQNGEENTTNANTLTPGKIQVSDILTTFPKLSLSNDQLSGSSLSQSELDMSLSNLHLQNMQNMQQQFGIYRAADGFNGENGVATYANYINFDRHVNLPRRTSSSVNLRSLANNSPEFSVLQDPTIKYQGSHLSGYSLNGQSQRRSGSHSHSDLHSVDTQPDALLERSAFYALQAASMLRTVSLGRNFNSSSYDNLDLQDLERVFSEAMSLGQQRQQVPLAYQYPDTCVLLQGNPNTKYFRSATMPRVQFQNERYSPFPTFKVQVSGSSGSCNAASGMTAEGKLSSSLLEDLKNNKNKSLELIDILEHFVEFSMDQYGSRFIQQKLEIATVEDKMKIFPWVLPHVRGLMTDVFGNYVIQKFFEHGTKIQRKELADQLLGHVLPLSLQMYGCRVIQKALEKVDLEQQIEMVSELDGSVMKCVYDQNGNHVIQKCIECIPQENIKFIISSFFGQVVTLSTHPYGCRVIQRVLENCKDSNTQQIIMDEIMKAVCFLAQDQYGNYVIQHVLQHGKPDEKTEIIVQLSGQIVKMSRQKFASNVVEKCLTHGGPEQRKIIINEMLGSTDENEALQDMMKDPFGNYVVQKVLETCDDECHELIISRIKVHLNALKKYTYGKHIVSRVEKLIETGERHRRVKA